MAVANANPTIPPRAAELTDPILRVLTARDNVAVWDVKVTAGSPTTQVLSSATYRIIEFLSNGQARLVGATNSMIRIYVRNAHRGVTPAERLFRVDIAPLTAHVSLGENW
jgi:hypothetical protein